MTPLQRFWHWFDGERPDPTLDKALNVRFNETAAVLAAKNLPAIQHGRLRTAATMVSARRWHGVDWTKEELLPAIFEAEPAALRDLSLALDAALTHMCEQIAPPPVNVALASGTLRAPRARPEREKARLSDWRGPPPSWTLAKGNLGTLTPPTERRLCVSGPNEAHDTRYCRQCLCKPCRNALNLLDARRELHLHSDSSGIPPESPSNQAHQACGSPGRLEQLLGTDCLSVWIHGSGGWNMALVRLVVSEFIRKGLPVWLETNEDGQRWRRAG